MRQYSEAYSKEYAHHPDEDLATLRSGIRKTGKLQRGFSRFRENHEGLPWSCLCQFKLGVALREYRAEQAAAALARLTAPRAKVVREGQTGVIAAAEVVPGDVLLVEAGDLVAADARLFDVAALHANEAPLTGESQPVEKQIALCAPDTLLADRCNRLFLGTSIVRGSGRAVVVTTGMHSEVGHIAELLQ